MLEIRPARPRARDHIRKPEALRVINRKLTADRLFQRVRAGVHDQHATLGLVDLIEMILDWKAASERHNDGNILKSIEQNAVRFGIGPEVTDILVNTVRALGFVEA